LSARGGPLGVPARLALRPRVRPTTLASYEVAVQRIARVIGSLPLQALTPLHVETLYADLTSRGGRGGRSLSPKTVRNCHIVLRKALADAERLGLVVRNVAAVARPPAVRRSEQRTWSAEELRRFLGAIAGDRLEAAFVLLATTGMRRGEVLGLRWADTDLPARRLSVVQTLTTVNNELLLTAPKTAKSRRRIALDPHTAVSLRDHKRREAEEHLAAGALWDGTSDLVRFHRRTRPARAAVVDRQPASSSAAETPLPPGVAWPAAGAVGGVRGDARSASDRVSTHSSRFRRRGRARSVPGGPRRRAAAPLRRTSRPREP
jgi:integrase